MKLATRATVLGKKITLISTAFILAVSTLTASVPFILSSDVGAVGVQDGHTWRVSSLEDLKEAFANPTINHITLDGNITTNESLVLGRSNVTINGNGKTITGPNLGGTWVNNGNNYALKIYRAANITINSLRVTGANAGIQINGSQVELRGHTNVSGNAFGGIELSRGNGVSETPTLLIQQGSFTNTTEASEKPSVWIAGNIGTVTNTLTSFTPATHIKNGQRQFYLNPALADVAATNVTQNTTAASLQGAIDMATAGDVIKLEKNLTLNAATQVNKAVTIDGNAKALTTTWTGATSSNNAALLITASGVTVKNITVESTSALAGTENKIHGINTWRAENVVLENITAKNNSAGVIVGEGSKVTIDKIHTEGNKWNYGINVDKPGAHLTIKGANSHGEADGIYIDNNENGKVTDVDSQYVVTRTGVVERYDLDRTQPTVIITNPGDGALVNSANVGVRATVADDNLLQYWFKISRNGVTVKEETVTSSGINNKTLYSAVTAGTYKVEIAARDKAGDGAATGNKTSVVSTFTIDRTAPVVISVAYSNNNGNDVAKQATVTIKTSESVNTPEGWTRVSDTEFTKLYTASGKYSVVVTDIAGNSSAAKAYEVKRVDGTAPVINGVTNGATVRGQVNYSVTDQNFKQVTVNDTVVSTAGSGWTYTPAPLSGDGAYTIVATDKAGNTTTVTVTINNSVQLTVDAIDTETETPVISGRYTYVAQNESITNAQLQLSINGDPYTVVTDANGRWEQEVLVNVGKNELIITPVGSTTELYSETFESNFIITIPTNPNPAPNPGENGGEEAPVTGSSDEDDDDTQGQPNGGFPLTTFGVAQQVLGSSTINNNAQSDGTPEVAGSTADNLAQAVDADNTDGTAMGLAWYWWLLILAGLSAIVWGIVAAIRGRQSA